MICHIDNKWIINRNFTFFFWKIRSNIPYYVEVEYIPTPETKPFFWWFLLNTRNGKFSLEISKIYGHERCVELAKLECRENCFSCSQSLSSHHDFQYVNCLSRICKNYLKQHYSNWGYKYNELHVCSFQVVLASWQTCKLLLRIKLCIQSQIGSRPLFTKVIIFLLSGTWNCSRVLLSPLEVKFQCWKNCVVIFLVVGARFKRTDNHSVLFCISSHFWKLPKYLLR